MTEPTQQDPIATMSAVITACARTFQEGMAGVVATMRRISEHQREVREVCEAWPWVADVMADNDRLDAAAQQVLGFALPHHDGFAIVRADALDALRDAVDPDE